MVLVMHQEVLQVMEVQEEEEVTVILQVTVHLDKDIQAHFVVLTQVAVVQVL
jgi:aspartyl aminopeptidase